MSYSLPKSQNLPGTRCGLYQGTTSVVPTANGRKGFSPREQA